MAGKNNKKDICTLAEAKYIKELHPLLIESLLQNGINQTEIIKMLKITPEIYHYWVKNYPEVQEAIKKGKEPVDLKVVNALYKSAMGYAVKEVTTKTHTLTASDAKLIEEGYEDRVPKEDVIVREKHIPPNVIAQIFWLKNRLPNDWKDDHSLDISSKSTYSITLAPNPDDVVKAKEIGSQRIEDDFKEFSEKSILQITDNDDMIIAGTEEEDD